MSINPALLLNNSAAATDEEPDWVEGEDNIFTVGPSRFRMRPRAEAGQRRDRFSASFPAPPGAA